MSGRAEVRKTFLALAPGEISACFVTSGELRHGDAVHVFRGGERVYQSRITQLRRFEDVVQVVGLHYTCGLQLGGEFLLREGDEVVVT